MQSEKPLTLILSPLRAGRGDLERTILGSLFAASFRVRLMTVKGMGLWDTDCSLKR